MFDGLVIGGGISGLLAAWRLRRRDPRLRIAVVEQAATLGGILAGFDYPEAGLYFDQGTHIFRECGRSDIDAFMLAAPDPRQLIHFPVGEGDLAGSVFDGRLQEHSHFPDLRLRADWPELRDAIERHVDRGMAPTDPLAARLEPALEVSATRFGSLYTQRVMGPLLEQLYKQPADRLAWFGALLPGLTRTIVHGQDDWALRCGAPAYRAVVGVPDQRALPLAWRQGQRSFYSRERGSRAFIDGIARALSGQGVEFLTHARIRSLDPGSGQFELAMADGSVRRDVAGRVLMASGVVGAARLLGVDIAPFGFERPLKHRVLNLLLDAPSRSPLCYLYGLDQGSTFYRITNYRAFCGDAGDCRLSVELLGEGSDDVPAVARGVVDQLLRLGFLATAEYRFADMRLLPMGFPLPSVRNLGAMAALGRHLADTLPVRVVLGGIGASPGLFFNNEVVVDMCARVDAMP